ncbi:hypothetical protein BD289DRAFT_446737, partial [Coniella lustricola]
MGSTGPEHGRYELALCTLILMTTLDLGGALWSFVTPMSAKEQLVGWTPPRLDLILCSLKQAILMPCTFTALLPSHTYRPAVFSLVIICYLVCNSTFLPVVVFVCLFFTFYKKVLSALAWSAPPSFRSCCHATESRPCIYIPFNETIVYIFL